MYLNQYEPLDEVEFDYAIIDLNLNSCFFSVLQNQLISLAPDNAKKIHSSFPYLLKLTNLSRGLLDEIKDDDLIKISKNLMPFLFFKFKSKPIAEPDLVKYLKNNIIYENKGKKYLYRFYDPRVWVLLNFFQSQDFSGLNRFFDVVDISYFKNSNKFKNILVDFNLELDLKLIEDISLINRVIGLFHFKYVELNKYIIFSQRVFEYIYLIKSNNNELLKKDLVLAVYHLYLLGEKYFDSQMFKSLINHSKGYEWASKETSSEQWIYFFEEMQILDNNLRDRVMYG